MRQPTPQAIELIKYYEGFSSVPYHCPAGIPTIGFGHVIRHGEAFAPTGITREEGVALLRRDVDGTAQAVLRLVEVPLTDGQFDALVSFTFNLGAGALQRSTLRRKLNRHEYAEAAEEFPKWCWAGGRKLPGLLRRRLAEQGVYMQEPSSLDCFACGSQ